MGHDVSSEEALKLGETGAAAITVAPRKVDLSIVMPAYNEAESLTAILPGILAFCEEHDIELIVVNDGSRDATADVLATSRTRGCAS
jgi:cellulose synthase/poly-beta-1,6-N-acetylglucosamine synthase-like glycosyltransferase